LGCHPSSSDPEVFSFLNELSTLILIGGYFSLNIDRSTFNQSLQMISKLFDEVSQYGKSILRQFQQTIRPNKKMVTPKFFTQSK